MCRKCAAERRLPGCGHVPVHLSSQPVCSSTALLHAGTEKLHPSSSSSSSLSYPVALEFPAYLWGFFYFSAASVHPRQLQTRQLLVVPHPVYLRLPGQSLCHHWPLLFPAWLVGLPAVRLWLHVSETFPVKF